MAQEAFFNAFQKLNTFRGHSAFYSWLFRIALNSAVSQKRKQRAVVSIDAAREQSGDEPIDRHPAEGDAGRQKPTQPCPSMGPPSPDGFRGPGAPARPGNMGVRDAHYDAA